MVFLKADIRVVLDELIENPDYLNSTYGLQIDSFKDVFHICRNCWGARNH